MKIVEVDCHISVRFGTRKREERHFVVDSKKIPDLNFQLVPDVGVRIWNHEDDVIVPFVNVTALRVEDELPPPSAEERDVLGMSDEDEEEEEQAQFAFEIKS